MEAAKIWVLGSGDPAMMTAQEYYARAAELLDPKSGSEGRRDFAQLTGNILSNCETYEGFDVQQMVEDMAALAHDSDVVVSGEARWQIVDYMRKHAERHVTSIAIFVCALADAKEPFNARAARTSRQQRETRPGIRWDGAGFRRA